MFSTLGTVKLAINIVGSLGVGKILSDVVKNNTTIVTPLDKLLVNSGTLVLGTMIGQKAKEHVDTTIDNGIQMVKDAKEKAEEKKAKVEKVVEKLDEEPPAVEAEAKVQFPQKRPDEQP
jgi:hypothetical protein